MFKIRFFSILLLTAFVLILPSCSSTDPADLYAEDPRNEAKDYFYYWPIAALEETPEDEYIQRIQFSTRETTYKKDVDKILVDVFYPGDAPEETPYSQPLWGDEDGVVFCRSLGIEKYEKNQWVPLKLKKESNQYMSFYIYENAWVIYYYNDISEEGTTSFATFLTSSLYDPLEAGHYRLIRFYGNGSCQYAEFDVID